MTSPVETWVAHVVKHTAPASGHWLGEGFHELSREVPSEARRAKPPAVIFSSRRLLFDVSPAVWKRELEGHAQALIELGDNVPIELHREHRSLLSRFAEAMAVAARDEAQTS